MGSILLGAYLARARSGVIIAGPFDSFEPFDSFASTSVLSGVVSLGLSTMVFPAANAGPIFQTTIMDG